MSKAAWHAYSRQTFTPLLADCFGGSAFSAANEGEIYVEPVIFKGGFLMASDALAPVR